MNNDDITRCLDRHRISRPGPDPFDCISLAGTDALAELTGAPPHKVMAYCLEHGVWPLRFAENRGVFSAEDQAALLQSHVAVIGCGGLGGHVIVMLARLGVGCLTVCDNGHFDESNLSSQMLCREDRLGMNKAAAAKRELALTAAHTAVRVFECEATPRTLPGMLSGATLAMGCLVSPATQAHLEQAAFDAGIACIHGAAAGYEGFACISRPGETGQPPPLARLHGETGPGRAKIETGAPAPTPAGTAVLQVMLALRAIIGPCEDQRAGIAVQRLDLALPALETLLP